MSGKYQNACPKCGKLEQLKPAGVSKKTGRNYDAFYACATPECWKTPSNQGTSVKQPNFANTDALAELEKRVLSYIDEQVNKLRNELLG